MAHFPMFIDLTGREALLVGTGHHAAEKAEKMAFFDCRLIRCSTEAFTEDLLTEQTAMVILADRHHPRNAAIAALCRRHHIPVNAVDDPPLCDFQFPSLICRDTMTIAISTSGKAPAVGRLLREEIERQLPDRTEEILCWSAELTHALRAAVPDYHRRARLLNRILRDAFAQNRPLREQEVAAYLQD